MAKKTLVDFVKELHGNATWQDEFENRRDKPEVWEKRVKDELSGSDANLVLDPDPSVQKVEDKLKGKTDRRIVWGTEDIVWMG